MTVIAVDGPAASGKGTLARRLAAHYGLHHLDTGLIYRAVAHALIEEGADLNDEAAAVRAAQELDPGTFDQPALKSHQVGSAASVVSAIPRLRAVLVEFQRRFAAQPPGAVLDGFRGERTSRARVEVSASRVARPPVQPAQPGNGMAA